MRYRVERLVNAGRAYVGRWVAVPSADFATEPEAMRLVEWMRDGDRWACGFASSYRVVGYVPATVDQICAELDGFMAEMQREVGRR